MKKTFLLLLVLVLGLVSAWAAGGSESSADEIGDITLSFYRYSNAAHNAYGVPIIETFQEEYPNIKIESVEVSSGGFEALANKVLLGIAAGTPPDVCEMGYTMVRTMVESGSVYPMDSLMAADTDFQSRKINQAMMTLGQVDGKQYLMPLGVSTAVMFINADLFRKVGLDPENPPKTWAEAEAAAQVLKDAGYGGIIWSWTTTGNWIFQNMIDNNGGRTASDDAKVINFNEKPGVEVMTYLRGLVSKGLMQVTDQVVQTFYTGNLGMIVLSSFNRVSIPSTADFDVVMAPMPTPDGSKPKLPAGGKGYMLLAEEKRQKGAWEFIRYLTSETAGRLVAENSGYTPINLTLIEKLKAEHADDPMFVLTLGQAEQVTPWYSWPGENGGKITVLLTDTVESILLGEETPEAGLNRAAAEAKTLLGY